MPKNIVLCADGTGNQDIKDRGTNVFRLYEAIDIQGHKDRAELTTQIAFYSDGVGTSSAFLMRVVGGAFGYGFEENVLSLYRDLSRVYREGDRIYIFGFSRGAYTARALAGLVQCQGLVPPEAADHRGPAERNWREFEKIAFTRHTKDTHRQQQNPEPSTAQLPITFLGVWDTVGAMGGPFPLFRKLLNYIYPRTFAELTLGAGVERACHALAIDEQRKVFRPELWKQTPESKDRLQQVWFAGVHSNVGGGYPKQGMALVALEWMMAEAENAGLRFIDADKRYVRDHMDVHGKLYDSRAGIGVYYRWEPRDLAAICQQHGINKPQVHISALERAAFGSQSYAPITIPLDCEWVETTWGQRQASSQLKNASEVLGAAQLQHLSAPIETEQATIRSGNHSYTFFVATSTALLLVLAWLGLAEHPGWAKHRYSIIFGLSAFFFCMISVSMYWSKRVDRKLQAAGIEFWKRLRKDLQFIFMR